LLKPLIFPTNIGAIFSVLLANDSKHLFFQKSTAKPLILKEVFTKGQYMADLNKVLCFSFD